MGSPSWSDEYKINLEELDQQHEKLFEILYEFDRAVNSGIENKMLNEIMPRLIEHTEYHFMTEDNLMKNKNFPGYMEHKEAHRKMLEDIARIQKRLQAGAVEHSSNQISEWEEIFTQHIVQMDKEYADYIND